MFKLPIIHLTSETLNPSGTCSWIDASKDVRKALEEYGCFIAIHDEYSAEKRSEIFEGLPQFFDLPTEIKSKYTRDGAFSTYVGADSSMPLYEGLSVMDSTKVEAVEKVSDKLWPSGNPMFCGKANFIAKKFSALNEVVGKMVFESYGVEKYIDDYVGSLTFLLTFIKYRVANENEINMGLTPHTDKGFITVLDQNGVHGLEIQTKDGEWSTVDFPPSSVFVIAGEALKAWSNGRIHPVLHRVTMNVKKERYTIAQFSYPIREKLVYAPQELIDDEHPRLYKPLDAYALRSFFHSLKGKPVDDLLKTYCGV